MEQTKQPYEWYGFTVDEEAREFRYRDDDGQPQTLGFDTVEGAMLYGAMKGTVELKMAVSKSGLTYMQPRPSEDPPE